MSSHLPRRLSPDEAHVWWIDASDARDLPKAAAILDDDERTRAARFHVETDRRLYTLSHALVRRALSAYIPTVAPEAWRFRRTPTGRPAIEADAHAWLRFNLTHTDGCAALVVTREADAGIDLESRARTPDIAGIAARWFTPEEAARLRDTAEPERLEVFLQIWTMKEAYVKATGAGLSGALQSVTCRRLSETRGNYVLTGDTVATAAWQAVLFTPTDRHVGAVCVPSTAARSAIVSVRALPVDWVSAGSAAFTD